MRTVCALANEMNSKCQGRFIPPLAVILLRFKHFLRGTVTICFLLLCKALLQKQWNGRFYKHYYVLFASLNVSSLMMMFTHTQSHRHQKSLDM